MSSLSADLYGKSINKGIGGLMSGLNTDDLVKQMTAATRNKINREYQSKQTLLYRQQSYREISSKLIALNNKYFSYSSGSKNSILSPTFFESYTYKSSSNYVNVTGKAENIQNFSIDKISSVATAANFASSKRVTSDTIESLNLTDYTSTIAGGTMTIEYGGKSYNLSIDKGFGNHNDNDDTGKINLENVATHLSKKIGEISDLKGLSVTVSDGKLSISSTDDKKEVKVIAASSSILDNLKFEVGKPATSTSEIDSSSLIKSTADIFANTNSYITFEYNGVLKQIKLNKDITKENIGDYLTAELNKAFGKDKVSVSTDDNKLSFFVNEGDTNIFGISSISSNLSNYLDIEAGDYNRLNRNKPLAESGLFGIDNEYIIKEGEEEDGRQYYKLTINNVDLEFEATMSVTDVINKINSNADIGIRVYYSSTSDTFTVKATETGSHKGISIAAGEKNLAQALFGSGVDSQLEEGEFLRTDADGVTKIYRLVEGQSTEEHVATVTYDKNSKKYSINYTDGRDKIDNLDYMISSGTDTEIEYTLNGVKNTITRSTANFTIDEINIELNEKASSIDFTSPVTFDVTNNSDEVVERVKEFINDYNEIINLISTKTSEKPKRDYPPLTPDQQEEMEESEIKKWNEEAKKGVLFGDGKMNNVLRSMREAMAGFTDVSNLTLSSIGISSASMDTSGKLVLDEKKFKERLLENPDEIARLFTGTTSDSNGRSGIGVQLQAILRANVGAYGTTGYLIEEAGMENSMTSDRNYISEKMEAHDDKMADLRKYLEREQKRYWDQFSALEQSLNRLNAQSGWLTDMMGGGN